MADGQVHVPTERRTYNILSKAELRWKTLHMHFGGVRKKTMDKGKGSGEAKEVGYDRCKQCGYASAQQSWIVIARTARRIRTNQNTVFVKLFRIGKRCRRCKA